MFEDIIYAWDRPLDNKLGFQVTPFDKPYQEASQLYINSLFRQYLDSEGKPGLRASGLGKPAMDIFARKFHPEWFTKDWQTERLTQLFHAGDTFEADLYLHLYRFGYEVIETQKTICFAGVQGHTDFIVRTPTGQDILLELKTCASHRFTQMTKGLSKNQVSSYSPSKQALNPNDVPMTYRTQLAVYQQCVGYDAYWCFYNKDTSDIAFRPFIPEENINLISRAELIISQYDLIKSWAGVFDVFCAPPPDAEKYKNAMTGNFKVPQDIDKQLAPHIYEVVTTANNYGKQTDYVIGYRMPDGSVEAL